MTNPKLRRREGQDVPDVVLRYRGGGDWGQTSTDELFANKNVIVLGRRRYRLYCIDLPATIRSKALGALAGARTVPQVFIKGDSGRIGGTAELPAGCRKQGCGVTASVGAEN